MQAICKIAPNAVFTGIAGPRCLSEGCRTLFPMDRLTVMGFIEPLFRLPELYKIRRALINQFTQVEKPDVFIGVDAPDFNLGLERILKQQNIPTVHYVSPTVWAWRRKRIHTIKKSVNLMLALLPFEAKFYEAHNIPVCFTGHPFADQIAMDIDTVAAKELLGFNRHQTIIALLPGSRNSELKYLALPYIETAKWCYERRKDLIFLAPLVSEAHRIQFETLCMHHAPEVPIQVMEGQNRTVMEACDVGLVTSGTATLEMALHKKPMVVAYRMNPITYEIAKSLIKVPYISQPNLIAGEKLVPEFIQGEVKPEKLGRALFDWLEPGNAKISNILSKFNEIHEELRRNAAQTAADAIMELLHKN